MIDKFIDWLTDYVESLWELCEDLVFPFCTFLIIACVFLGIGARLFRLLSGI